MNTMFKNESEANRTETTTTHELFLNGFQLSLSSAKRFPPAAWHCRTTRNSRNSGVHMRTGLSIGVKDSCMRFPATTRREQVSETPVILLECSEHLQFIVSLIDALLPKKFPGYDAFRRHPFAFAGKKDEIVGASATKLRTKPALLKYFTIRPTFILEAKIIETVPDQTAIGLFLTINTKWECTADLTFHAGNGVVFNLSGFSVVRVQHLRLANGVVRRPNQQISRVPRSI